MAIYAYRARTGEGQIIVGRMDAETPGELTEKLKERGLLLLKHRKESGRSFVGKIFTLSVPAKHLIPFTHHLRVLQAAGVPILEGLEDIREVTTNNNLRKITSYIMQDLNNGAALSDAMAKYPNTFSPFYIGIVRVGESTGKLDQCLSRLADYLERRKDMKNRVIQALSYPLILVLGLSGLIVLLTSVVLPKITGLYKTLGRRIELPEMTQWVMAFSSFMSNNWGLMLVLFFLFIMFLILTRVFLPLREMTDQMLLKIPFFGAILQKDDSASFAHALVTLQRSGVEINESLERCEEVVKNVFIRHRIRVARAAVAEGKTLYEALHTSNMFPGLVVSMIKIGESTGKLDQTLDLVCGYYDEEVPRAIKTFITFFEPAIIFVAGGAVLFLILATLLPIYKLISSFA